MNVCIVICIAWYVFRDGTSGNGFVKISMTSTDLRISIHESLRTRDIFPYSVSQYYRLSQPWMRCRIVVSTRVQHIHEIDCYYTIYFIYGFIVLFVNIFTCLSHWARRLLSTLYWSSHTRDLLVVSIHVHQRDPQTKHQNNKLPPPRIKLIILP